MKILTTLSLICASALTAVAEDRSPAVAATREFSIDQAVRQVSSNSPALAAARFKWQAMRERPEVVRALPDPMLTYGYWFQNVETRVGANNQRVGVAQKLPFFGRIARNSRPSASPSSVTNSRWRWRRRIAGRISPSAWITRR